MKFVIQRVAKAMVTVDDDVTGAIGKGFVVFVGISQNDNEQIADKMVDKLTKMRIFEDDSGKTNLDLKSVNGRILMISQFTLYADCKKGNRPSFIKAGSPDEANRLYEYCIKRVRDFGIPVESGIFGADMKVSLLNNGPFTIVLDSEEIL